MKLIFLDIDGVLIRFGSVRKYIGKKGDGMVTELEPELVNNLVRLVEDTGARIVISSSWRRNLMDILTEQLAEYIIEDFGTLTNNIIGVTPHSLGHGRGNEILTWINEHHKEGRDTITHWVSIDDSNADQKAIIRLGNFVHCNTSEGLTNKKVEEAIRILNN